MVKGHLEPKRPIRPECITEEHIPGYYHSPLDRKLGLSQGYTHQFAVSTHLYTARVYNGRT